MHRQLFQSFTIAVFSTTIAFAASPAPAEVTAKNESGFHITLSTEIDATPDVVYETMTRQISKWWHPDHTYTTDSSNLYLEAEAHGWFAEKLEDDGVCCHMEVVFVQPGKVLRLAGGLGPLQSMGVNGAMTFTFSPSEGGTKLDVTYIVSGFSGTQLDQIADPVDFVLTQQVTRLKSYVETGSPE